MGRSAPHSSRWTERASLRQALLGKTQMGFQEGRSFWVDVDFSSRYLMVTQRVGQGALSGRLEAFRVQDRNRMPDQDLNEHGWAATGRLLAPTLMRRADCQTAHLAA